MEGSRLVALVVCCSLISSVELQPFYLMVKKEEVNATVGDTVVLSARPSVPVSGGFWKFGTKSIVVWTVEAPYLNVAYTKRLVHLLDNTSLLMFSVTLADSGDYWVTMDSPRGDEATAKITLNVFPKPVPFSIAVKHREINTTDGDTVVLSVSPSQEVKNGSWTFGGKDVVMWEGTVPEINVDYRRRVAILAKNSLQLKSVRASDTGEYRVAMSTDSGNTSTAKIYLNVRTKRQPIDVRPVLSSINAEYDANVLLSVMISGEVKNGSWSTGDQTLFQWNSTLQNVTLHPLFLIDLLPNASLLLLSVHEYSFPLYIITLESPSGDTATANITLNVFRSSHSCTTYNVGFTISVLLALVCILVFANHIYTNVKLLVKKSTMFWLYSVKDTGYVYRSSW
ncbi:muscle M-line assembly protein unc-89-like [Mustelus asterias]